MKSVYPVGTTLYQPENCSAGYNLVSGSGVVKLVTMNGEVALEALPERTWAGTSSNPALEVRAR